MHESGIKYHLVVWKSEIVCQLREFCRFGTCDIGCFAFAVLTDSHTTDSLIQFLTSVSGIDGKWFAPCIPQRLQHFKYKSLDAVPYL